VKKKIATNIKVGITFRLKVKQMETKQNLKTE